MKFSAFVSLTAAALVQAGTVVWDGSFDPYNTPDDFAKWSWSNETGTYQYYIHGSGPPSDYLALSPSYKNPADTRESHGLKMTITPNATWNSQMERIELIPQTTANLGNGTLYYHFSVMRSDTNAPNSALEHQVFFFESHFTQLKYGVGSNPTDLQWFVSGTSQWSTPFTAGTWFNFAYEIDFTGNTVGLWASTGGAALTKVVANVATTAYTNSEDFHVGVLRIVNQAGIEDWYVSGVYIESGPITTAIGSGSGSTTTPVTSSSSTTKSSSSSSSTTKVTTTTAAPATTTTTTSTPTTVASTTSTASGATATHYGQCGGTGYTGPTTCASPYTCTAVSAPYYYQCL